MLRLSNAVGAAGQHNEDTQMTEDYIERRVELDMDKLDRAFLKGDIDQAFYDREVQSLNRWAETALATISQS